MTSHMQKYVVHPLSCDSHMTNPHLAGGSWTGSGLVTILPSGNLQSATCPLAKSSWHTSMKSLVSGGVAPSGQTKTSWNFCWSTGWVRTSQSSRSEDCLLRRLPDLSWNGEQTEHEHMFLLYCRFQFKLTGDANGTGSSRLLSSIVPSRSPLVTPGNPVTTIICVLLSTQSYPSTTTIVSMHTCPSGHNVWLQTSLYLQVGPK